MDMEDDGDDDADKNKNGAEGDDNALALGFL
jgi:hypothetical protein